MRSSSRRAEHDAMVQPPLNCKPAFLDFFAGAGLVTEALSTTFCPVWANDICEKKAAVYNANHTKGTLRVGPIERVRGKDLPRAALSWASFPCQDLSVAGKMEGIGSARSGLVWNWLRVMDEMVERPGVVVAENVVGLVSAHGGTHYRRLHEALVERRYRVGAVIIDARFWLPQSRQRVFVIGVSKEADLTGLTLETPDPWYHPAALREAAVGLRDWLWWALPRPFISRRALEKIIDFDAPTDESEKCSHNLGLIPEHHREMMYEAVARGMRVFPGYKRIRKGRQVLELRFDGLAGCLRTPRGGSSRQVLVIYDGTRFRTSLLTVGEATRLMGLPPSFRIPGTYNEGYQAMGDAVAIPVVRHLGQFLLHPLVERSLSTTEAR